MIDKKEIEAYMNIKAPDSLREGLLSEQAKKHSHFTPIVRVCYGLAAAFAVIIAVFAFYPNAKADVYFNGQPIGNESVVVATAQNPNARIAPVSVINEHRVQIELKTKAKTTVTVSDGYLQLSDSDNAKKVKSVEINSDSDLLWSFDPISCADGCTMTVKTKNEVDSYCISLNNEAQWVLSKK